MYSSPFTSVSRSEGGSSSSDLLFTTGDASSATYWIGWGLSDVITQLDITSSITLQDITGLVQVGMLAGKRYKIEALIFISNTANNGAKFTMTTDDTMTADYLILSADSYSATGSLVTHNKVTALGSAFCAANVAIERIEIKGLIDVGAAGSLRLQAAQNTSHADTLSILAGSHMLITQMEV